VNDSAKLADTGDATAIMRGLAAAAAEDTGLRRALYSELTGPAHRTLTGRLARAQTREPVEQDAIVAEALLGIMLYRQLTDVDAPPPTHTQIGALLGLPGDGPGPAEAPA
jgi:hypothetical protein